MTTVASDKKTGDSEQQSSSRPGRRPAPPKTDRTIRQTARDAELLLWAAQMYGIPLDLLRRLAAYVGPDLKAPSGQSNAERGSIAKSRMYALVKRWEDAGWIERGAVDAGPSWVWPRQKMARALLGYDVGAYRPSPATAGHHRAVQAVRMHHVDQWVGHGREWTSEREILHATGWRGRGQRAHTPDGILTIPGHGRWLVEVELTGKTPDRLEAITRELSVMLKRYEATGVLYVCAPKVLHAVGEVMARRQFEEQQRQAGHVTWRAESIEGVFGWSTSYGERSGR